MKNTVRRSHFFLRKSIGLWIAILAIACSVSCSRQEFLSSGDRSLNVLVITLDTIRADRLGAYGNPHIRTDFVDGLTTGATVRISALLLPGKKPPQRDNEAMRSVAPQCCTPVLILMGGWFGLRPTHQSTRGRPRTEGRQVIAKSVNQRSGSSGPARDRTVHLTRAF